MDLEQPEDADDSQLAWLLSSAHEAPEMRPAFASELAGRLDAEFAARNRAGMNGAATPSRSGAASKITPYKPVPKRRRWAFVIATAASLLAAAVVLRDPPAWAAAFLAIVNRIGDFTIGEREDQAAGPGIAPESVNTETQQEADNSIAPERVTSVDVEVRSLGPAKDGERIARSDAGPSIQENAPHSIVNDPAWLPFAESLSREELSERIDHELAAVWQANGIRPVGPATDAEFMRRAYLDLVGRIPSPSEVQGFLEDPSSNRREALVERLLEHLDHATHLAAVWRNILLPSEIDLSRLGGTVKFDEWLAARLAENRGYDEIVRELLTAEGRVAESGPLLFYAALRLNPEELAGRTSRAFLGVRMECAQCHDHFFDDISQNDFWSFAAFFARISRPRGKMEMTSPVLAVRDNQQGDVTIPDSADVVPPRLPGSPVAILDSADGPPRREVLVDWLTSPNNGQFARATVNRVWAHLFGRGLVEPVDDMRPDNKPIAPEVLETLSRNFAASEFDLRGLFRAIVLSKTYQLASRSEYNDPARTLHFAQMNIKSFTAEQLYDCIAVATRQEVNAAGPVNQPGLERFADTSRQAFVQQFRAPADQVTDYHAGIPQALTLMHGGLIHNATDVATSGLLKSLAAPFFTDEQRIDTLFLATLSRYPTDTERDLMLETISAASTDTERQQALGDMLWALLNSAEFTFNH
jgi:hypothetical protein